ncbi:MAG: hypothetical protein LBK64_03125 [Spirochaetaceae bacterium]|jgi:hypothetical protein|nr:hypothetical protein [Spirochaetaceae bacterium]
MWDLAVLTALATFLLALPLIRPFFKGLWPINGLVLLPLTAFLILFGLFRAYGFRPECLPLLLFAAFLTIAHIPALFSLINRLHNDDFRDRKPIVSALGLAVLAASSACALYFSPYQDTREGAAYSYEAEIREAPGTEGGSITRYLRVYSGSGGGSNGGDRAVIALIPPLTGSVEIIEPLCGRLNEAGYTVVTFSRQGLDNPAAGGGREFHRPLYESIRLLWSALRARDSVLANRTAGVYEEKRMADAGWLLDCLRKPEPGALAGVSPRIVAAGYGAGGAALSLLASDPAFAAKYPELLGFVSIEGPPASVLTPESFPSPSGGKPWEVLKRFFLNFRPRKLTVPDTIRPLLIPGLFITAGQIYEEKYSKGRYDAIRAMVRGAGAPSGLRSLADANFLDYADCAGRYPIYQWLLRHTSGYAPAQEDPVRACASFIADFAADQIMKTIVRHEEAENENAAP